MVERPPLPPRTTSSLPGRVTFEGAQTWRESLAAFIAIILGIAVFISVCVLGFYAYRDKGVYEELVDYLDKTISISKINYNALLGLYQLNTKELEVLSNQRTYKTILWCFLAAELACYLFISLVVLLYFTTAVGNGRLKIFYWTLVIIGAFYCIADIHLFTFVIMPYSAQLPNSTEQLLNHAIPHNPGGLQQMEMRFSCTFDHNIYATNKRRMNPKNTCDPHIENSFISKPILFVLLVIRLLPIVIGVLLMAKRTPFSELVAQTIEKIKSPKKQRLYVKKQQHVQQHSTYSPEKKSTTFGVTTPIRTASTPLPPITSPSIDHSISYNNAAYLATSAPGMNSSRSSEISRIDAHDLFRTSISHHASGSLQSEV
ncbi:unnamed protein product [Auanema sp. JU1783]|nr:unnamed protein product [Auanema sp. JU1783]